DGSLPQTPASAQVSALGVAPGPSVPKPQGGAWGKEQRPMVFYRSVDTHVPGVLLSALAAQNQQRAEIEKMRAAAAMATSIALANKGSSIKLMKRNPSDPRAPALGRGGPGAGAGGGGQVKTVSEREKEYAEARARIFGTASPPAPAPRSLGEPGVGATNSGSGAATATAATTTSATDALAEAG
ncbi:unnamed protein product, partial [Discosporangium mesarthrocarpum]